MASASRVAVRKRLVMILIGVLVMIAALSCRLVYLQVFRNQWLSENAIEQRIRNIPIEPRRGTIYDRNGKKLAVSISVDSVYAIPAEIYNAKMTAANLAAILDLDEKLLYNKLNRRQSFVWIARKITKEQAVEIRSLNLSGIGITEESERYYPYEHLAAHILGFSGVDGQGLDGIELTLDEELRGKKGDIIVEYDGKGREIPNVPQQYRSPEVGNDVKLTIDIVIQEIIERELERIMKSTQAKAATIIAIQPYTGDILALANRPTYNPNKFGEFDRKTWRNIAIADAFEPGSTFKIITTAAALEEKIVNSQEHFFDSGAIEVQGRTIHCWKHGGHGSQTFREVVENSCNTGFVTLGLRLGKERFYRSLKNFNFGEKTQIDLPGEANGILIQEAKVVPINLATMAMGQSIAVTPIQLVSAAAAVVNGGYYVKPQIVDEIIKADATLIKKNQVEVVRSVLSEEVSKETKDILKGVVAHGTGKNAQVEGYSVGGKTGTAQKVGLGGYMPGKYIASFMGFVPAEKPEILVYIAIDEPVGVYYGGQIAAPVFKNIMEDILKYLKIDKNF